MIFEEAKVTKIVIAYAYAIERGTTRCEVVSKIHILKRIKSNRVRVHGCGIIKLCPFHAYNLCQQRDTIKKMINKQLTYLVGDSI